MFIVVLSPCCYVDSSRLFNGFFRFINSFLGPEIASLNSLMPLPIALPTSGNLPGPKITRAITNITINSGVPIDPYVSPLYLLKTYIFSVHHYRLPCPHTRSQLLVKAQHQAM